MMNPPLTPQDWEVLSEYLDGQLTEAEQSRVRVLLERRPELQEELEVLRRTRQVLRAAPRRRAPRNFTLTPTMAQQIRPRSLWSRLSVPSFGFASALATLLFVLSFFFRPISMASTNLAPMMASAPVAARDQAQSEYSAPEPAPIIIWQEGGRGGGPTGTGGMGGAPGKAVGAPTSAPQLAAEPTLASDTASSSLLPTPTPVIESQPRAAIQPTTAETAVAKAAPMTPPFPTGSNAAGATVSNGPILGVVATEDRGQESMLTQEQIDTVIDQSEPELEWGWVQAGLAGGALLSATVAWVLWQRSRR
jgi:hypothetical protein